jgi:hypothetical protein
MLWVGFIAKTVCHFMYLISRDNYHNVKLIAREFPDADDARKSESKKDLDYVDGVAVDD